MSAFQEQVHTFGADGVLLGIASVPDVLDPQRPAVVLMNAGLVHRVGPFRLHVEIARRLAAQGSLVLRIDQSSLGDSGTRPGSASYEARAVLDGRESMDFLAKRYGCSRFIVAGLCSGAMNTHRVMTADARVVGACLLDPYAYRTREFWRHRLLPKLVNHENWLPALKRLRAKLAGASAAPGEAEAADAPGAEASAIFAQDWPPRGDVQRELEAVVARGTRLLFLYTGGWSDFVCEAQFDEMFPGLTKRGSVTVRYSPDADHTYVLREQREAMLRELAAFVATVA